jgi:hypothetical protein
LFMYYSGGDAGTSSYPIITLKWLILV